MPPNPPTHHPLAAGVPHPAVASNREGSDGSCHTGDGLRPLAAGPHEGWEWVDEGRQHEGQRRWGYVSTTVGSKLVRARGGSSRGALGLGPFGPGDVALHVYTKSYSASASASALALRLAARAMMVFRGEGLPRARAVCGISRFGLELAKYATHNRHNNGRFEAGEGVPLLVRGCRCW